MTFLSGKLAIEDESPCSRQYMEVVEVVSSTENYTLVYYLVQGFTGQCVVSKEGTPWYSLIQEQYKTVLDS